MTAPPRRRQRRRRRRSYHRQLSVKRVRVALSFATLTLSSALAAFAWQARDPFDAAFGTHEELETSAAPTQRQGSPTGHGRTRGLFDQFVLAATPPVPARTASGASNDGAADAADATGEVAPDGSQDTADESSATARRTAPTGGPLLEGLYAGLAGSGKFRSAGGRLPSWPAPSASHEPGVSGQRAVDASPGEGALSSAPSEETPLELAGPEEAPSDGSSDHGAGRVATPGVSSNLRPCPHRARRRRRGRSDRAGRPGELGCRPGQHRRVA